MGGRHPVRAVLLAGGAALLACGRTESRPPDSAAKTQTNVNVAGRPIDWVDDLGTLLVVPSDSANTAVVLFPPAPSAQSLRATPLTLLSASGDTSTSRATLVVSDSQVCGVAPTIHLQGPIPENWSVGLHRTRLAPLSMDSIEMLTASDSARFAAELARLASTLPAAGDTRFAGLPFVVLTARRFMAGDRQVVAAHMLRRLPQEATPLEEHVLLLGERSASATNDPYVVAHHLRSEGTEDSADHFEVLAALGGDLVAYLLVSSDRESQTRYDILAREKSAWRVRWSRTLAC